MPKTYPPVPAPPNCCIESTNVSAIQPAAGIQRVAGESASSARPASRSARTGAGSGSAPARIALVRDESEALAVLAALDEQRLEHRLQEEEAAPALVVGAGQVGILDQRLHARGIAAALVGDAHLPAAGLDAQVELHAHVRRRVALLHRRVAAAVVDRVREQLAGDELERVDL